MRPGGQRSPPRHASISGASAATARVGFGRGAARRSGRVGRLRELVAYDVQIQWHTMPATVVTVLAAVTSFAAAGVAVAGLARSVAVAQAVPLATAVLLAMVSGLMMGYGGMPTWADRIAQVFPVKPFNDALLEQFDPYATGNGWNLGALAIFAAWTAGAAAVAALTFRWDPVPAKTPKRPVDPEHPATEAASIPVPSARVMVEGTTVGRPGWVALVSDQARWATQSALHDTSWVVFAIAIPVNQYLLTAALMDPSGTELTPPFGLQSATGMIAWGAILTAMVFMPGAIAHAREQGILKRLRGTPLRIETYFTGRFTSALLLVLATAVLILLAGMLWFELAVAWSGIALAVGLLLLGTATLAACGLLLVSVLPSSKAVTAVGLGLAFPLAFFSDVWAIGVMPQWMSTVGSFFPLKHLANSMSYALDPTGPTVSWLGIAVMTAWLVGTALLATRWFRWSARP